MATNKVKIEAQNATVVFVQKEQRHCGNCGKPGHNVRTCPEAQKEPKEKSSQNEEVVYWTPDMFSGAGMKKMPAIVKWQPGTDSIAFQQQMKGMSFYTFDPSISAWRRN